MGCCDGMEWLVGEVVKIYLAWWCRCCGGGIGGMVVVPVTRSVVCWFKLVLEPHISQSQLAS